VLELLGLGRGGQDDVVAALDEERDEVVRIREASTSSISSPM
jgi:hypothetical protein